MNKKKLVAPIVVTILMVLLVIGYLILWLDILKPLWVKIASVVVCLALIGVNIGVLVERVKELKKGEEDDLSKY